MTTYSRRFTLNIQQQVVQPPVDLPSWRAAIATTPGRAVMKTIAGTGVTNAPGWNEGSLYAGQPLGWWASFCAMQDSDPTPSDWYGTHGAIIYGGGGHTTAGGGVADVMQVYALDLSDCLYKRHYHRDQNTETYATGRELAVDPAILGITNVTATTYSVLTPPAIAYTVGDYLSASLWGRPLNALPAGVAVAAYRRDQDGVFKPMYSYGAMARGGGWVNPPADTAFATFGFHTWCGWAAIPPYKLGSGANGAVYAPHRQSLSRASGLGINSGWVCDMAAPAAGQHARSRLALPTPMTTGAQRYAMLESGNSAYTGQNNAIVTACYHPDYDRVYFSDAQNLSRAAVGLLSVNVAGSTESYTVLAGGSGFAETPGFGADMVAYSNTPLVVAIGFDVQELVANNYNSNGLQQRLRAFNVDPAFGGPRKWTNIQLSTALPLSPSGINANGNDTSVTGLATAQCQMIAFCPDVYNGDGAIALFYYNNPRYTYTNGYPLRIYWLRCPRTTLASAGWTIAAIAATPWTVETEDVDIAANDPMLTDPNFGSIDAQTYPLRRFSYIRPIRAFVWSGRNYNAQVIVSSKVA